MSEEEIIKYIFDEENYSNFISSQNGGEQYYILLEKEESKILKDYISNLQKKIDKYKEVLDKIKEDIEFCINNLKNEYACTDKRTNRELHTTVKILEEALEEIE